MPKEIKGERKSNKWGCADIVLMRRRRRGTVVL